MYQNIYSMSPILGPSKSPLTGIIKQNWSQCILIEGA